MQEQRPVHILLNNELLVLLSNTRGQFHYHVNLLFFHPTENSANTPVCAISGRKLFDNNTYQNKVSAVSYKFGEITMREVNVLPAFPENKLGLKRGTILQA